MNKRIPPQLLLAAALLALAAGAVALLIAILELHTVLG
jgi:hypothetical protein